MGVWRQSSSCWCTLPVWRQGSHCWCTLPAVPWQSIRLMANCCTQAEPSCTRLCESQHVSTQAWPLLTPPAVLAHDHCQTPVITRLMMIGRKNNKQATGHLLLELLVCCPGYIGMHESRVSCWLLAGISTDYSMANGNHTSDCCDKSQCTKMCLYNGILKHLSIDQLKFINVWFWHLPTQSHNMLL